MKIGFVSKNYKWKVASEHFIWTQSYMWLILVVLVVSAKNGQFLQQISAVIQLWQIFTQNFHFSSVSLNLHLVSSFRASFRSVRTSAASDPHNTHLVPAFEWVFPPFHQVAFTDPRDTEVQRGAWTWLVHHLPVTRLKHKNHLAHNPIYICFLSVSVSIISL